MKRRTVVRTSVLLGALCISVWRAPDLIERVEGMMQKTSPQALIGDVAGAELPLEIPGAREVKRGERRGPVSSVLLSGNPDLSEEELARLEAEARALAPKPVEKIDPNR